MPRLHRLPARHPQSALQPVSEPQRADTEVLSQDPPGHFESGKPSKSWRAGWRSVMLAVFPLRREVSIRQEESSWPRDNASFGSSQHCTGTWTVCWLVFDMPRRIYQESSPGWGDLWWTQTVDRPKTPAPCSRENMESGGYQPQLQCPHRPGMEKAPSAVDSWLMRDGSWGCRWWPQLSSVTGLGRVFFPPSTQRSRSFVDDVCRGLS
ncbi:hypothetical protein B0T16DRAFT_125221 [Cercophora newfieldiana]|uniref:Uncharacterized protein n=1 Tax=Cercophora newfieldiana TaxID=92897 RepID=A0AA40CRY2_9PEZI|nr:hypothetical protein B0T16DRAFT_125221 [Cercophora newfieldiana]